MMELEFELIRAVVIVLLAISVVQGRHNVPGLCRMNNEMKMTFEDHLAPI